MRARGRFALGGLVAAGSVLYGRAILARNAGLRRPRVRRIDGTPLAERRFTYSDGETVTLIDEGQGPPLLWVPGADGPKETFRFQLPYFAGRYRVVCADLRASFRQGQGFDRFADDLAELVDRLDTGPVVLIGQSLGSAISLRFAARFPHLVEGMILSNPLAYVSYDHVGLNRTALVPLAIGTTKYLPTPLSRFLAGLWSRLRVWIYDNSPGRNHLIDYALYTGPRTTPGRVSGGRVDKLRGLDLTSDLASIDHPTLVVKGPEDVYCPVSWAIEIVEGLPDARYVSVPGTGHCSHISRPGAFNRIVEDWLATIRLPLERRFRDSADGERA